MFEGVYKGRNKRGIYRQTSSASKIIYQQPTNMSFYNIEGGGYSVRKVNSVIT